jgi:hypothetical protein
MRRKGTKQLERELKNLKTLIDADSEAERLRRVVVAAVDARDRRELRQYCRLARKVDSPELRKELSLRLLHDDAAVRRRSRWALDACEKPG